MKVSRADVVVAHDLGTRASLSPLIDFIRLFYLVVNFSHVILCTSSDFLDVTLSILGSFKLDVTLLFWVITSLYLSPITCSHGTLLFFILSISLLSKNYLKVRDLKSVTSKRKRRKYVFHVVKKKNTSSNLWHVHAQHCFQEVLCNIVSVVLAPSWGNLIQHL